MLNDSQDDSRLLEVARDYLAELEAGRQPDRQAYLARHPELREELAECLDGIDLAQALRPPGPLVAETPAQQLGDFQIVREIGRGGMGVVYEAVQLSLGRRVALKILPFSSGLDNRHLQRFKTEAAAAAQLHHTNIVPVYSIGCERGVHFYAMQLIEGQSLANVIFSLRQGEPEQPGETAANQAAATVRSGLPASLSSGRPATLSYFKTAARIAARVADALEYAHEAGVIHRDIKPANLLLDGRGAVWVTDFGLAQVLATDLGPTQTGDMVGTLRYMSPEQASGRRVLLDHRTDVYSLGATLYEMLTLTPVFPGQDRLSLLHQILNDEPRPPRQLDRSIPIELETIVLKALAKSPAERYSTAGEMAADLRRFLEERPILARRPTLLDRGRKWLRRHPGVVTAAVILLLLGSIGLAVATALIAREQGRTQQAYDREKQRALEAESRFQQARRVADELIAISEEELADDPFRESLRKRLLETALAYYQEFVASRQNEPDSPDLAATRDRVTRILADLAVLQGDRQTFLLREPGVLEDLGVGAEQRPEVEQVLKELDQRREQVFGDFWRTPTDDRRQRLLEAARANEAALAEVLHPRQVQRLQQLSLQARGSMAFRDPEVVRELKLTTDQKQRLRQLERGWHPERNERGERGNRPGPGPGMVMPFLPRLPMDRVLAILTPEQVQRWQTMTGKPFAGNLPLGPRPSGPPRRP